MVGVVSVSEKNLGFIQMSLPRTIFNRYQFDMKLYFLTHWLLRELLGKLRIGLKAPSAWPTLAEYCIVQAQASNRARSTSSKQGQNKQ